jgi:hypothetical protein
MGLVDHPAMRLKGMPAATRDRLTGASLTYSEVGATAGELPARYHHLTRCVIVGTGRQVFADAGNAVAGWQVQLRAGVTVSASSPTALPGTVVLLGLGVGPLRIDVPCRVVYVVDQPRRRADRRFPSPPPASGPDTGYGRAARGAPHKIEIL